MSRAAPSEIVFVVRASSAGGFVARAVGESIFTEADTLADLRVQVRDAMRCHFDEGARPAMIRFVPSWVDGENA